MEEIPEYVNADMTISEAVLRYPVTAEIMMSYGLHCVGCHVSGFESIREGAMGHGMMDEEDVDELIREMNKCIHEQESNNPIHVTREAMDKIIEFAQQEKNKNNIFLRIKASKDITISYSLDFDDKPSEKDIVIEGEIPIRIDEESFNLVKGSMIDYVDSEQGAGFKITNPQAS